MTMISFYDLLVQMITWHYPHRIIELHGYYWDHKHKFYSELDDHLVGTCTEHLPVLGLLTAIAAQAIQDPIQIFYQDVSTSQWGEAISPAQFWRQQALFYQGGGLTSKLPGHPTLCFSDNIVGRLIGQGTAPNQGWPDNHLISKFETVAAALQNLYPTWPVLGIKKLSQHIRALYPLISHHETYILARLLKANCDSVPVPPDL